MSIKTNRPPLRVTMRKPVSRKLSILLGISVWVIFFAAWELAVVFEGVNVLLVPPPEKVLGTLYDLLLGGNSLVISASVYFAWWVALPGHAW